MKFEMNYCFENTAVVTEQLSIFTLSDKGLNS